MQTTPTFSIIVPTFNRLPALQQCLISLCELDYPPESFEIIVVDDGCDPEVPDLQNQGRIRIRKLRQANAGPGAARNSGAAIAEGEFLAFTDDDCRPGKEWLRGFAQACRQNPGAGIGGRTLNGFGENVWSEASQTVQDVMHRHFNDGSGKCIFFPSNNLCFPRRDFLQMGGFNEAFRTSEDRELCDRWIAAGKELVYSEEALIHHYHFLRFGTLFAQHFSYGKGANHYYQTRKIQGRAGLVVDLSFYRKLLLNPVIRQGRPKPLLLGAILLTQIANAAGYFGEKFQSKIARLSPAPLTSRTSG